VQGDWLFRSAAQAEPINTLVVRAERIHTIHGFRVRPNRSLKLTRYGMRCLAAPGTKYSILPRPSNTCLRGQLSSNVRHHKTETRTRTQHEQSPAISLRTTFDCAGMTSSFHYRFTCRTDSHSTIIRGLQAQWVHSSKFSRSAFWASAKKCLVCLQGLHCICIQQSLYRCPPAKALLEGLAVCR
jgi:hypothetical protein